MFSSGDPQIFHVRKCLFLQVVINKFSAYKKVLFSKWWSSSFLHTENALSPSVRSESFSYMKISLSPSGDPQVSYYHDWDQCMPPRSWWNSNLHSVDWRTKQIYWNNNGKEENHRITYFNIRFYKNCNLLHKSLKSNIIIYCLFFLNCYFLEINFNGL